MRTIARTATMIAAAAVLAVTAPRAAVAQTTLTGTWDIEIDSPEGTFQMTWELEQHEDGTVTGKQTSDMAGESAVSDGWVDGDTFGLSLYVEAQGEAFDIVYEGTFTEEEVIGDLDVGGGMFVAPFSGVRGEGGVR